MIKLLATLKSLIIYTLIFSSVFVVSTLALARKVNRYKTNFNNRVFQVEKEIVVLTNPSEGRVERVLVSPGQHVKAGDVLIELSNEAYSRRLNILEEFSGTNESARTEAELLRLKESDYIIVAPVGGIVKEVSLAAGSYIPANTKLISIYSDADAKLVTHVDNLALGQIQKTKQLEVYNPRLGESFFIEPTGISEVVTETNQYKVTFKFMEDESSEFFVHGENVETAPVQSADVRRPAGVITDIWNGLIIQDQN